MRHVFVIIKAYKHSMCSIIHPHRKDAAYRRKHRCAGAIMEKDIIRLRPHHALCLRHFVGKGYSDAFVKNMTQLHRRLHSGSREMVQIILHRDSLCGACPHDVDFSCEMEEKVRRLDAAVAQACGLRSGQWLSWQELCALIDAHMMPGGLLPEACGICEWHELCARQHL